MLNSADIKIINPVHYQGWNEKVIGFGNYSIFHSSEWAKILSDTYGYTPSYFVIESNGTLLAIVPMMIVDSYLTGKRLVSLPFTDFCRPLLLHNIDFGSLYNEILKFSRVQNADYIMLKDDNQYLTDIETLNIQYHHRLNLLKSENEIFSTFVRGNKYHIKKAAKDGVTVRIDNTENFIKEFCKINIVTRKKHGLPPQPTSFFRNLYEYFISKDSGFIALAEINNNIIAGAVYLTFGSKVEYKYSASYPQYSKLGANNLLMWEAIKHCKARQFEELSMGITESANEGLRAYKNGWGTDESIIRLFKYNLNRNVYESFNQKLYGFHNIIFNKTPAPLLKVFSSVFYKHFG